MQLVDTHQHLWDLDRFNLPWVEPGSILARSHRLADYLRAADGCGIARAIYMEVDVHPAQQRAEADAIIELCESRKGPTVAAVIAGRPESEGFQAAIAPFCRQPIIKGVRRLLHRDNTPPGYCLAPNFIRSIGWLGDQGLRFDVCVRPIELADAAKLMAACPQTRFVLDHCGNADLQATDRSAWQRGIEMVAARPNVVCKVSGFIASAKPGEWTVEQLAPVVNHVLDSFGPDRVMFGSDWPVCNLSASLREWVDALRTIVQDRTEAAQRKLFAENAIRFYDLGN